MLRLLNEFFMLEQHYKYNIRFLVKMLALCLLHACDVGTEEPHSGSRVMQINDEDLWQHILAMSRARRGGPSLIG